MMSGPQNIMNQDKQVMIVTSRLKFKLSLIQKGGGLVKQKPPLKMS